MIVLIPLFTHIFSNSFIHLFIYFIHLIVYLSINSFIHLFIYLFITHYTLPIRLRESSTDSISHYRLYRKKDHCNVRIYRLTFWNTLYRLGMHFPRLEAGSIHRRYTEL